MCCATRSPVDWLGTCVSSLLPTAASHRLAPAPAETMGVRLFNTLHDFPLTRQPGCGDALGDAIPPHPRRETRIRRADDRFSVLWAYPESRHCSVEGRRPRAKQLLHYRQPADCAPAFPAPIRSDPNAAAVRPREHAYRRGVRRPGISPGRRKNRDCSSDEETAGHLRHRLAR